MTQRRDKKGPLRRLFGRRRSQRTPAAEALPSPQEQSRQSQEQSQQLQMEFIPFPVLKSGHYGPHLPTFLAHLPRSQVYGGRSWTVQCGHSIPFRIHLPRHIPQSESREMCTLRVVLPPVLVNLPKSYRVALPPDIVPTQLFYIPVATRLVALTCPKHYIPGQTLTFQVPFLLPEKLDKVTVLPPEEQTRRGDFVKLQLSGRRKAWFPCRRGALQPGQRISLDSSQLKEHVYEGPYPDRVQPGRRFLINCRGKTLAVDAPVSKTKRSYFTVPMDTVAATNLVLVDAHVGSSPDTALWNRLAIDELAHVLDYLPVREVREWRLGNVHFAAAGKLAMGTKLLRSGVTGSTYAALTHQAHDFCRIAEEYTEANQRQFREAFPNWPVGRIDDRFQFEGRAYVPIEWLPAPRPHPATPSARLKTCLSFVPDTYLGNNPQVKAILADPALLARCQVTAQPRNGTCPTLMGVDLDKVGLTLSVWIPQYRQELEHQWNEFLLRSPLYEDTRQRVASLLEPLRVLDAAGVRTTVVSYIPYIQNQSSTPLDQSLYEYVAATLDAPLRTKFCANLKGVGCDPGIPLGTNLQYTGLWLTLPIGRWLIQEDVSALEAKILYHVKACQKQLLKL